MAPAPDDGRGWDEVMMRFTKMHGIGNDYVYVNTFDQPVPADPSRLAVAVSDRHFGIGADGLILIVPSDRADARMRMFNADGSEAEMCGNGVRCVAKYIHDHGIDGEGPGDDRDRPGRPDARPRDGRRPGPAGSASTWARRSSIRPDIPTLLDGHPPINVPLRVDGSSWP